MAFTPDQQKAIEFSGNDLIISAAAGSGKTTTLITKITESIKKGADVSRMLIVTFTKAAANELRSRLSRAMSDILRTDPKNAHISSQLLKLGNADICTIDSFCIRLLRPNFDKVGIDSDFRIGEESEIAILRTEAMEDVIDSFYEKEERDEDFFVVCDCFGNMANDETLCTQLLSLYLKLVSTKESIDLLLSDTSGAEDFLDTPYGKIALNEVRTFTEHYTNAYRVITNEAYSDEKTKKAYIPTLLSDNETLVRLEGALTCPTYKGIRDILSSYKAERMGQVRGECSADTAFIKDTRDDFKSDISELRDRLFASPPEIIDRVIQQNTAVCRAIHRVLTEFEIEFTKRKKAYGVCDFNDIERYALKLLYTENGERSEIAREWADRYDSIYIDEYQDTNSVQDAIFSAIARKNRFMVGDIKQCIYKFRSAEPEIFAGYRESFTPIERYREGDMGAGIFMSENFRSDKGVIDFANLVSDYTLSCTRGIPYSERDRLICAKNGGSTGPYTPAEIYLIDKDDEGDENPEAALVCDKIKELLDREYLPNGEKVMPRHIAILLRSKEATEDYINALNKRGIMSEYVSETRFFEKSEILLILCLLNVIDSPTRDAYLAGALMSGVFGFTLSQLVKIRSRTKELSSLYASCKAYDSDDETAKQLTLFFDTVEKYRERARRMPAHEVISTLYAELGITNGATPSEGKSLRRLYDMARRYEGASHKGLSSFLRYVDKISSGKVKDEIAEADRDNCVRVMTVHSSKGLEFEYCFLSETSSKFNSVDTRAPLLFERRLGVSGFVSKQGGLAKYDTVLRACAARSVDVSNKEEEMRILYVALTRAKHKMTVTARVKDPASLLAKKRRDLTIRSEYSVLKESSALMWILGACAVPSPIFDIHIVKNENENSFSPVDKEEKICYNENEVGRLTEILRERFSYRYPLEHLSNIPSKLSVSRLSPTILDGNENEEVDLSVSIDTVPAFLAEGARKATGADIGTATHLFMQFCNFEELHKNGAEAELMRLVSEGYLSEAAGRLVDLSHIRRFCASELFDKMRSASRILREFRFNVLFDASELSQNEALSNEEVLVQGVIDCVFTDRDGNTVLVDYKTDRVTKDNYVDVLTERHKNQLRYYKKACEMMLECPVNKVLIYSVPLAECVEITQFEEE